TASGSSRPSPADRHRRPPATPRVSPFPQPGEGGRRDAPGPTPHRRAPARPCPVPPHPRGPPMTDTAPTAIPAPSQVTLADGRVELAPDATAPSGRYANADLLPVPVRRRTWTTYNFSALWVGMAHNTASWTLASGL